MGIFINQVGYQNDAVKRATCLCGGNYKVINKSSGETAYEGCAVSKGFDETSGDACFIFDFSELKKDGEYYITDGAGNSSDTFAIGRDVYINLQAALLKCLYFQRCGCTLEEKYAGVYKHACCHTGTAIMLEDYLAKNENAAEYEMTGGWHDAGDFGKYISPAAVAVAHLLYAYELFPESLNMNLNIPESDNDIPDILNEVRYELEWMLKMQAPDGGAYHKLTAYNHADFIMPEDDHDQFIIFPVSSIATADYAAALALASRVYRQFDEVFADTCLNAARKAFDWLTKNDYIGFHNPEGSNTGEYDDDCDMDERMWAAAEMLRTDKCGDTKVYADMLKKYVLSEIPKTDFGWTDVAGFTLLSVLTDKEKTADADLYDILAKELHKEADRLVEIINTNGYETGMEADDYVWGSNMVVANRGMLLVLASYLSEGENAVNYKTAAETYLHYLLGRNALGRSYITGFGEHAYKNPHNRTSACDGIDEPMLGWVSGGPFKTPCDPDALAVIPAGTPPMKCHADVVGSYSTNEITIYWNSPVAFITAFLNR